MVGFKGCDCGAWTAKTTHAHWCSTIQGEKPRIPHTPAAALTRVEKSDQEIVQTERAMGMGSLIQQIEALRAENKRLSVPRKAGAVVPKVTPRGAVSVYGLQRFPVTLYANQWERLLRDADTIRAFIADNAEVLSEKS